MSEVIDGVKHADRVLRYLRVGVAVSQQNIEAAIAALDRGCDGAGDVVDVSVAREVLAASRSVMPSEQRCEEARGQVLHLCGLLYGSQDRDFARPRG